MRWMRLPALLSVIAVGAACSVPVDAGPRPYLDDVAVEAIGLVPATTDRAGEEPVELHFVSRGALVAVSRGLPSSDPEAVAGALVDGPLPGGEELDLRSAIPPQTEVLSVTVDGTVATVDLTEGFALVGGAEELLAVGQIVLTLAGLDGVEGVRFSLEGTAVAAPVGEGQLTDRPLVPDDFAALLGE
jgi:hypothetical protein